MIWNIYYLLHKSHVDHNCRPYIDSAGRLASTVWLQSRPLVSSPELPCTLHIHFLRPAAKYATIQRFLTASRYINTVVLGRFSILKPWVFSVIFGHLGWHGCAKSGSSWFERRVNDGGLFFLTFWARRSGKLNIVETFGVALIGWLFEFCPLLSGPFEAKDREFNTHGFGRTKDLDCL